MSIDMKRNFLKLLVHFRRHDLDEFSEEHNILFKEAKKTGDHLAVTSHYYSVMSSLIDEYFGGNFHFAAPKSTEMSLEEALTDLHRDIGKRLDLCYGKKCLDLGCGIGGVIKDLMHTGAELTGVTIAANEVEIGNAQLADLGVADRCRLVEGDCHKLPIEASSQDAAYAIYALKYFPELDGVISEVARVLKPGGKFLIYDLIKTEKYDENNEAHREIIEGLEYACGMPSLHSKDQMIESAEKFGLTLEEHEDLSDTHGEPFHYCFSSSPFFMWLVESPIIGSLIKIGQAIKLLPSGFHRFNYTFLSGTVDKIVKGGQMGILSGSEIFVFTKK